MRCRKTLKSLDTMTPEELLDLFDRSAWTLGFASLSSQAKSPVDTEAAVVLIAYFVSVPELRLSRVLGVLVHWLTTRHHLLHAAKLLKMTHAAEANLGEIATLRIAMIVLHNADPKKFQKFKPGPPSKPFYLNPRLGELVDQKSAEEWYYLDLPADVAFRVPKSAFKQRASDLLPEAELLKRNEQLRYR